MFYTYGTNGATGPTFIFQQQAIPEDVIKVMRVANSDPVVNHWCAMNGVHDAYALRNLVFEHAKRKWESKLRPIAEAEIKRMWAANPIPENEPKPFDHYDIDAEARNHETFYYFDVETGATLYQCTCGMLVFGYSDENGTLIDELVGNGHVNKYRHNRAPFPGRGTRKPVKSIKLTVPVAEAVSRDGGVTWEEVKTDNETGAEC